MRSLIFALLALSIFGSPAFAQEAGGRAQADRPQWVTAEAIEANLAAALEDESARTAFLNSFLNGEVWVRVDEASVIAEARRQREGATTFGPLNLITYEVNGQTVILAFTRPEIGETVLGPDARFIGMSGLQALQLQTEHGLTLNYNNGPSVTFPREHIAALLGSLQPLSAVGTPPAQR